MKKFMSVIAIAIISVMMLFVCACSPGAPEYSVKSPDYVSEISAEKLKDTLREFVTKCEDRTTYSAGEKAASEYLYAKLLDYGYGASGTGDGESGDGTTETKVTAEYMTDLVVQDMHDADIKKAAGINSDKVNLSSQNIVAKYNPASAPASAKNVILGAYYDNRFYKPEGASVGGFKAAGAVSNGTGVATLLAIAEYLCEAKPQFDFTVTVVFFGASAVDDIGVQLFCDNSENTGLISRTVLMVELQRLGVDHVYAFSDVRETKREHFFDGISAKNGLDIYKPTQKSPIITGVTNLDGIPFVQWSHVGLFADFFGLNIPTLNLMGANWETINTSDRESADHANVSFTSADTLANLEKSHPDYADKMRTAATLVIKSMQAENFIGVMTYDREHFPDTDILTMEWIWYLVALGVIVIAGGIMMLVTGRVRKKYPVVHASPKRMKMAVFGMDYEDKSSADIFIDVRGNAAQDEIFPGIPNNDAPASGTFNADPFADIFAGMAGMKSTQTPDAQKRDDAASKTPDAPVETPFDFVDDSEPKGGVAEKADDVAKEERAPEQSDESAPDTKSDNAQADSDGTDIVDSAPPAVKKARAPRTSTTATRKTVSAGKSASAKKTTHKKEDGDKPEQ